MLGGVALTVGGIVFGAATFSIANAARAIANDRKRCGECKPQPSEAEVPGSSTSIALGTALDAVPEALVLGVALRGGGSEIRHWLLRFRSRTSRRHFPGRPVCLSRPAHPLMC
jgi:hypothetical protein